ncbi:MAG: hypothetical protein JWL75_543 [Parcubacteria group bacterium]|nr:hypothetical protein [Parcubacteria group bacterium]
MDITQTTTPPALAPLKRTPPHARHVIIGLVVGILVVLVAAGYWFTHSAIGTFYGVEYVAGPFESRTVYQIGLSGARAITLPVPGKVFDYARNGSAQVALATATNGDEEVYRIEGGTAKMLTNDGMIKSGIALSADGKTIAYAERITSATSTDPNAFYEPNNWTVQLIDTTSSKPRTIGIGYGPQFFVQNGSLHLLYTSSAAIHLADLVTNTHQDIPVSLASRKGFRTSIVSADGTYLILPDVAAGYALYTLTFQGGLATFAPVGPLPSKTSAVAFKGNTILSVSDDGVHSLFRTSLPETPSRIVKARLEPLNVIFKLVP